jgi:hypothetical protein
MTALEFRKKLMDWVVAATATILTLDFSLSYGHTEPILYVVPILLT